MGSAGAALSAKDFTSQVREFSVGVGGLTTDAATKLMFTGFSKLVLTSPVGNPDLWRSKQMAEFFGWQDPFAFSYEGYVGGRWRGNWQVTVDKPAEGVLDVIDQSGTATISAGLAVLGKVPPGAYPLLYATQNLPYSEALEMGHSTQAPIGVLGPTFLELEAIAQALVDSVVAEDDARTGK